MQQTIQIQVEKNKNTQSFYKEGAVGGAVGLIPALIGIGITAFVMFLLAVIAGKTYGIVEDDIVAIQDVNVEASVKSASLSAFETIEQTNDILPLVALIVAMGVLIVLVSGFMSPGGQGFGGGGGVL